MATENEPHLSEADKATAECACCGDRFECDDPSDPDNNTCPTCMSERAWLSTS